MINVSLIKSPADLDAGESKLFGDPTLPGEWMDSLFEEDMFFAQIRLAELASLGTAAGGLLPSEGYLYFFIDRQTPTPDGGWLGRVMYTEDDPDTLVEDFNLPYECTEDVVTPYRMDFTAGEGSAPAPCRLFEQGEGGEVTLLYLDNANGSLAFPDPNAGRKILRFVISAAALRERDFSRAVLRVERAAGKH